MPHFCKLATANGVIGWRRNRRARVSCPVATRRRRYRSRQVFGGDRLLSLWRSVRPDDSTARRPSGHGRRHGGGNKPFHDIRVRNYEGLILSACRIPLGDVLGPAGVHVTAGDRDDAASSTPVPARPTGPPRRAVTY